MSGLYIDVYIAENLLMNYVITHIVSRILKEKTKVICMIFAAVTGTAYAVLSIWLRSFMSSLILKALLSSLMVYIAYKPKTLRRFLSASVYFYTITFLFAGISYAVLTVFEEKSLTSLKCMYTFITVAIGYIIAAKCADIYKARKNTMSMMADMCIELMNRRAYLTALIDTGNELKDPLTGKPVIVAEISALGRILPDGAEAAISQATDVLQAAASIEELKGRIRIIPFSSLGCKNGMLSSFKTDRISIKYEGNTYEKRDIVVCLYIGKLTACGDYTALLSPELVY